MDALFAQVNKGAGPGDGPGAGFFLALLCFYGVLIVGSIGLHVMYLLSMSRCLKEVAPRNRKMEPGQVWLCFIPLFGAVWSILMVLWIAESLDLEYEDRDMQSDGDFGKTLGIVSFVSAIVGCFPVALVCFIMYWIKINGYTRALRENPGAGDDYDDDDRAPPRRRAGEDDDYDDDRPARRPR